MQQTTVGHRASCNIVLMKKQLSDLHTCLYLCFLGCHGNGVYLGVNFSDTVRLSGSDNKGSCKNSMQIFFIKNELYRCKNFKGRNAFLNILTLKKIIQQFVISLDIYIWLLRTD